MVLSFNQHLLWHLNIGHAGVIQELADRHNKLWIYNVINWIFSSKVSIVLSFLGYPVTDVVLYPKIYCQKLYLQILWQYHSGVHNLVFIGDNSCSICANGKSLSLISLACAFFAEMIPVVDSKIFSWYFIFLVFMELFFNLFLTQRHFCILGRQLSYLFCGPFMIN